MRTKPTSIHNLKERGKVTSKDVAKMAGVSQSTVSRVLSGKKSNLISEKTTQRVIEISNQMGYTPNPIASALRGKKSHLLGVIVREIADPFFSKFISILSTQARLQNYNIVLGHAHSDPIEALEMSSVLDARHTDGVFLLGDLHDDEAILQKLLQGNRAIVALCRGPSPASVYTVNTDNFAGTQLLLDHLYEFGHRKIGFIDGGWLGDIKERKEAYISFIKKHNLPFFPDWIQSEINGIEGGYRAMQNILALSEPPTAVFISDDFMAIGALKAGADFGIVIPKDISVVGFDDIEISQYLYPSLTTIHQPVEEMCYQSLKLLLELVEDENFVQAEKIIRIPPKLVIRHSSGPVPTLHI